MSNPTLTVALARLHAVGRIRIPRIPVELSKTIGLGFLPGETSEEHAWRRIVRGFDSYDVENPWTKGEMLALLREAAGDPTLHVECRSDSPDGWKWSLDAAPYSDGDTEGQAIAAALIALAREVGSE